MTHEEKLLAQEILEAVQDAQNKFWDALNELEAAIGKDLDSVRDFAEMTLDDLLKDEDEEDLDEVSKGFDSRKES